MRITNAPPNSMTWPRTLIASASSRGNRIIRLDMSIPVKRWSIPATHIATPREQRRMELSPSDMRKLQLAPMSCGNRKGVLLDRQRRIGFAPRRTCGQKRIHPDESSSALSIALRANF